jgi:hypothetical protein
MDQQQIAPDRMRRMTTVIDQILPAVAAEIARIAVEGD